MRRTLVQIEGYKRAEQFFSALLADRRHGNLRGLGTEDADVVIRDEESNALGGSGDRSDDGAWIETGTGSGGASTHT